MGRRLEVGERAVYRFVQDEWKNVHRRLKGALIEPGRGVG